jgi:hypothetical protein
MESRDGQGKRGLLRGKAFGQLLGLRCTHQQPSGRAQPGCVPIIALDCYSMSDMPRIADQIPHRSETTLSATSGLMHHSKY